MKTPSSSDCVKYIKYLNMFTGLAISVFGAIGIFFIIPYIVGLKFFLIFSPIMIVIIGLLTIAAEFKIKWVLENFSFMTSLLGRGVFNIFLCSVVFYFFAFSGDEIMGYVCSMIMFAIGVLYMFLHFCAKDQYSRQMKEQLV